MMGTVLVPVSGIFRFDWWYRKNLVSKKVSEPVSEKFGTEKSIGIGIESIWYQKKSIGIGIV